MVLCSFHVVNGLISCRLIIRPRMLCDVSKRDLSVSVLNGGEKASFPIFVAAVASQRMAHADGEIGTARGKYYTWIMNNQGLMYAVLFSRK